MKDKILITGASTTGKTTLLNYFKDKTDFALAESDDELSRMNGGNYPKGFGVYNPW